MCQYEKMGPLQKTCVSFRKMHLPERYSSYWIASLHFSLNIPFNITYL